MELATYSVKEALMPPPVKGVDSKDEPPATLDNGDAAGLGAVGFPSAGEALTWFNLAWEPNDCPLRGRHRALAAAAYIKSCTNNIVRADKEWDKKEAGFFRRAMNDKQSKPQI